MGPLILKIKGKHIAHKDYLKKASDFVEKLKGTYVVSFMPISYKTVVFCQNASGSWGEGLLEIMGFICYDDFLNSQTNEGLKALHKDVLLTVAGLKILKTDFKDNAKEWKLVAAKGASFIKKAAVSMSLEQILAAVVVK